MYANTKNWITAGLVGLPLYGALTLWSSLTPQPDPATEYEAWTNFVTTNEYVVGHLIGSGIGLIAGVFGTVALGAYLTRGRSPALGLWGMVIATLGAMLFLMPMGVSTFSAPAEGFAFLASGERAAELAPSLSAQLFAITFLSVIVLSLIGNIILGIAVWRSGILPRWTGVLWAAAPLLMYVFGIIYALVIGVQSTPPTVPLGAALLVVAGGGILAYSTRHPFV
jgi:hypothetical protein